MSGLAELSLRSTIRLRRGVEMPIFGLGTWLAEGGVSGESVVAALDAGYRLIDTASAYENEEEVGAALRERDRTSFFIVTKVKGADFGRANCLAALDASLHKLGVDSLDLWLMHGPGGGRVVETWKAMLEARDAGKVRAVGVTSFGAAQLAGLAASGCELPEVNQIELHLWNHQRETVDFCRSSGIAIMAFCPLARAKRFGETALARLAAEAGVSEAHLALRWLVHKGHIAIPKSTNAQRISENALALDVQLTDEMLAVMEDLDEQFFASKAAFEMMLPWDNLA